MKFSTFNPFKILYNYLLDQRSLARIQIALTKGYISSINRSIQPSNPMSWEFSGFSQNGEDGIIDFLISKLTAKNNYFIEIGSSFGTENNSSWLVLVKKYDGIMIEGSKKDSDRLSRLIKPYSLGLSIQNLYVNLENIKFIKDNTRYLDPDVFSVDIDGMDYHIVKELFNQGFRPSIFIVEYNSVFGHEKRITIPYEEFFNFKTAHKTELYYGVSIALWKSLFAELNYSFITVDSKGVNAFFVNNEKFDREFIDNIESTDFAENTYQKNKFNSSYKEQFKLIENLKFLHDE